MMILESRASSCGNTYKNNVLIYQDTMGRNQQKGEIQTPIETGMDQDCLKSCISVSIHMKRSSFSHVSFDFYFANWTLIYFTETFPFGMWSLNDGVQIPHKSWYPHIGQTFRSIPATNFRSWLVWKQSPNTANNLRRPSSLAQLIYQFIISPNEYN